MPGGNNRPAEDGVEERVEEGRGLKSKREGSNGINTIFESEVAVVSMAAVQNGVKVLTCVGNRAGGPLS